MPDACHDLSSDLVARAVTGDEGAVAALYDRYAGMLYAVSYAIIGGRSEAEDVVAEAFAQVWREASRFEAARGSVAGWMKTIARSRARDLTRSHLRRERATSDASARLGNPPGMGVWRSDPAEDYEQAERQARVRQALGALSSAQREAIELAFYHGLSQSEIAERLNVPLGTVKARVRSGMLNLRSSLASPPAW